MSQMSSNTPYIYNPLTGDRPELVVPLHDGTEEQVSIIVVHNDKPEYLNICLQSIFVSSINNNYEVIVVDNGSGKESQDFLDEIKDEVKVIRCEKNLYWGPAIAKGVQVADRNSKYYVFLHHDVVITNRAWLDMLINVSTHHGSGMVGVELGRFILQDQPVDFIQEWCLLMTKEAWRDMGPPPETLPQIGTSFIMTTLAQKKGYKPQIMRNPICHHYRVFSLDVNEFEKLAESAKVEIPRLIREIQTS
jgi:glycosyltransferase involved in cell wall biosynthesis